MLEKCLKHGSRMIVTAYELALSVWSTDMELKFGQDVLQLEIATA